MPINIFLRNCQVASINENEYIRLVEKRIFSRAIELTTHDQYFHWELEFPEIFLNGGGFACIVGNPPYIEVKKIDDRLKPYLRARFSNGTYELLKGRYDIYWAFIILALRLVNSKGLSGLLTSNTYGDSDSASNLRHYLLQNYKIIKIADFGRFSKTVSVNVWASIISNEYSTSYNLLLEDLKIQQPIEISLSNQDLLKKKGSIIKIADTFSVTSFLRDFTSKNSNPLGEIMYLQQGIIVQSKDKKRDDFIVDRRISPNCRPYLEGKDISRFFIGPSNKFLLYSPKEHHRPRIREVFESNKILVKRIASEVQSVVDDNAFFTDNTIFTGTLYSELNRYKEDYPRQLNYPPEFCDNSMSYDYHSINMVLNSRFLNYLNTIIYGSLSLSGLNSLPIPIIKNQVKVILSNISKEIQFLYKEFDLNCERIGCLANIGEALVIDSYQPVSSIINYSDLYRIFLDCHLQNPGDDVDWESVERMSNMLNNKIYSTFPDNTLLDKFLQSH